MKKVLSIVTVIMTLVSIQSRADEGMWLPMLIKRLNYQDMQKHGLQLTAEEIYSVNNSSLKDAIVALNGGSCTAETISEKGLLLTNHHCAFGVIQDNSLPEHDYLTDGFWAMAMKQELHAKNMSASYLIEMRDVTDDILSEISITLSGEERSKAVRAAIQAVTEKVKGEVEEHYDVRVKGFFEGNEYYLFVYETFRDLRLVGAPPSSIGKYGGDTDNWMWPRHTGDFSLLRVYMGEDGKPADYSESNIPYKPKHFLPISISGVEKGDYTMIMGYPGSTDRYLSSYGVKQQLDFRQPSVVKIREQRLALLKEDMNSSAAIRIKYASKYAQVSNYWKYFIGQQRGLKRLKVQDQKKELEDEFDAWVNKKPERKEIYGNVTKEWASGFENDSKTILFRTYFGECIFASEATLMGWRTSQLYVALSKESPNQEEIDAAVEGVRSRASKFFQDYNRPTDEKVSAALFKMFHDDIPADQLPEFFKTMVSKSKGDYAKMISKMYAKSIFADEAKFNAFLDNPSKKVLDKDPVYQFASKFINHYRGVIIPMTGEAGSQIDNSNRLFVNGLRKMNSDKTYYPNANSTMRVTYGNALDYYPADAMYYNYYTTIEGIMEKEDPTNDEFVVPAKLKELYQKKDYGQYGQDGTLRVCFLSNTDITGGNSGSPVINGQGQLIGCAFDGNWEAMSGDIAFEPKLQRTIAVDVRYILFIIDKYAGAQNIIDELSLVKTKKNAKDQPQSTPSIQPIKASK
ncbi:MAG TPA: serine protease [Flavobacteriales bacterium]|nr:serine protease [Flavobacteriales bacterium]